MLSFSIYGERCAFLTPAGTTEKRRKKMPPGKQTIFNALVNNNSRSAYGFAFFSPGKNTIWIPGNQEIPNKDTILDYTSKKALQYLMLIVYACCYFSLNKLFFFATSNSN